ncbi:MAG TPA: GerMN domain-containing protein [Pyrinomonadaceae bacterium]|nr:GerMN domain-containing protein [Pyrinomonadaceae bacterium]
MKIQRLILQILFYVPLIAFGAMNVQGQLTVVDSNLREARIYWSSEPVEKNGKQTEELPYVTRKVDAKSPLRPALEILFAAQITPEEEERGFWNVIANMKFEGVELKNGTALVRFSQPPNETNYGSLGAFFFAQAIEKTAKQFPTVKRVKICAVGETFIDSELDKPFPRCSKKKQF